MFGFVDIPEGTLPAILKQAVIDIDEFLRN